jgi:integrase
MATREQLDKIIAGMPAHWAVAVLIMRGCGLRIGGALAVRSDSVHGDVLRVEEQILAGGLRGPLKHRKPGEFRDIPLPRYVAEPIAQHVAEHGEGWLFPEFADGIRKPDHWRRAFVREAGKAGLPAVNPHELRHMYASACLASPEPISITDVSRWLGHRDINLTHRVYGHMVPSAVGRAIKKLDADW